MQDSVELGLVLVSVRLSLTSCGQILTIMDCMRPTSLEKGCCVIQEGDDGSTVYVMEGETPHLINIVPKPTVRVQTPNP